MEYQIGPGWPTVKSRKVAMVVRLKLQEQELQKRLSAVQAELRKRQIDLTGGEKGTVERILKVGPQHVEKPKPEPQVVRAPVLEDSWLKAFDRGEKLSGDQDNA